MAHVRQQIRDAVVVAVTNLTTTGSNVFRSRVFPLESAKLPALAVYTKSETIEYETMNFPRSTNRTLNLGVEAFVKSSNNFDNLLDNIAVEVEEALTTNATLQNLVKDTRIASFEADYSGDGETTIGIGRFDVVLEYRTLENDVENAV